MSSKAIVAATRRLPAACETRLSFHYDFRPGDDGLDYTPGLLATHAAGASALIVSPCDRIEAAAIKALPASIKIIASFSVGYEHIDLAAARARNLRVTNTPGVLNDATADIALLLILGASRRALEGRRCLEDGTWAGFRPTFLLGTQLTGKRLGIVGMGGIGAAVAKRAQAFGMSVLYHNRKPIDGCGDCRFFVSLEEMMPHCDVLSLHLPLTAETRGLIDAEKLAWLPAGAIVVNTARGGLVDDDALIAALASGKIAAAGLDVFAGEPRIDPRYLTLDNVFLLPHLGSATVETRTAMGMIAITNINAVMAGKEPPYPVI
ncbi:MAG: 2-hydroxyacid dehydrogenase [Rhodospirillaceae bacterium]